MTDLAVEELLRWLLYVYIHGDDKCNAPAYNQIRKMIKQSGEDYKAEYFKLRARCKEEGIEVER